MKTNSIQFAVVREDPQIELRLIEELGLGSALLIGSGGCTALSIKAYDPSFSISLMEPNPAQISLIQEKIQILSQIKLEEARKIIGRNGEASLIEKGNFESLFKMLRTFIYEFVIEEKEFRLLIEKADSELWDEFFEHSYWWTAFDLFFSNSILVTMFGPAAIQYAPRNSYPLYFRKLLERGLRRSDAKHNYFLHHIFFGQYSEIEEALPYYLLREIEDFEMSIHSCFAEEFTNYEGFDLVGLSNILDWSSPQDVELIAGAVSRTMDSGSVLLYRQLNNTSDFKKIFQGFRWQEELEEELLAADRSLFYSKICVGVKE